LLLYHCKEQVAYIFQFEFDETKVFTRFTILGVPNIKGDVPFPVKQVSLDEAEGFLNRSIGAGKFLVYYLMRDGKVRGALSFVLLKFMLKKLVSWCIILYISALSNTMLTLEKC